MCSSSPNFFACCSNEPGACGGMIRNSISVTDPSDVGRCEACGDYLCGGVLLTVEGT